MNKDWSKWLLTTMMLSMAVQPASALAAEKQESSTGPGLTFQDYTKISPNKIKAVQDAVSRGLMSGYPDGAFHPERMLTREELAVVLAKALQLTVDFKAASSYSDSSNSWGTSYIEAVRKAGLMGGDSNDHFRPSDPVTREELATVFVRAIHGSDVKGGEQTNIDDASQVSSWASKSVDAALRLGLVPPTDKQFGPKEPVQREDIALFLTDIFSKKEQVAVINKIDGDVVTINGKPYLIDDQMKKLFSSQNKEALEGATLKYTSSNRSVDGFAELEIVKSGKAGNPVVLDLAGTAFNGVLRIAGDYVAVKGASFDQVEINKGAAHFDINGKVNKIIVNSTDAIDLTGTSTIESLKVADKSARITLGPGSMINKLELPQQVSASDVFANYESAKNQIAGEGSKSVSSSGSSGGSGNRNHSPQIAHAVNNIQTPINHGDIVIHLADTFIDSDSDTLTLGAVSSNTVVASVYLAGTDITVRPLTEGVSTITVTANDGRSGQTQTSFEFHVVPPEYSAPMLVGNLANKRLELAEGKASLDLTGLFEVWQGDTLQLEANSSQTVVASVYMNQNYLEVTPLTTGESQITVTATNSKAEANETSFQVNVVDTTALAAAIGQSETLASQAVAGTSPGYYLQATIDDFRNAIEAAKGVIQAQTSTQADIEAAKSLLDAAVTTFKESQITDLEVSLADGAKFYMNSGMLGTSGDVTISDTTIPIYQYGKRNILSLLKIKTGGNATNMTYDVVNHDFDVKDSNSNKIADVTISSDISDVEVTANNSGFLVHLLDAVTEDTKANLVFNVKGTDGVEVSQKLPITMDQTAPTLTSTTYSNGSFVLTSSEELMHQQILLNPVTIVEFSASGDFNDGLTESLVANTDYSVTEPASKQISITLNPSKMTALQPKLSSTSKFRITVSGYIDAANNSFSEQKVIQVSQF